MITKNSTHAMLYNDIVDRLVNIQNKSVMNGEVKRALD